MIRLLFYDYHTTTYCGNEYTVNNKNKLFVKNFSSTRVSWWYYIGRVHLHICNMYSCLTMFPKRFQEDKIMNLRTNQFCRQFLKLRWTIWFICTRIVIESNQLNQAVVITTQPTLAHKPYNVEISIRLLGQIKVNQNIKVNISHNSSLF